MNNTTTAGNKNTNDSQQQPPIMAETTTQGAKKVLIFVHGMYGSNLIHKTTQEQSWLSPKTVLKSLWKGNHGHTKAASKITWSEVDGKMTQDEDEYIPGSAIDMFTKPWDDWCSSLDPNVVDVRYFLWDWRRPMEETTEKFNRWTLTQGLSNKNPATLVTYSTGSLLAWPVVNQHPELFSNWLNVGGAIGAGNFMINDLTHGWFKNNWLCLLDADTAFTFPSMYSFFAAKGEPTGASNGDHLWMDRDTGEAMDIGDRYDLKTWKEHSLGIYQLRAQQNRTVTVAEELHLKNTLDAANRFRQTHFVRNNGAANSSSFDDPAFLVHSTKAYEHLNIATFGSESWDNTHCGWYGSNNAENDNNTNTKKKTKTTMKITIDPSQEVTGNGDGTIMTWAWKAIPGGLPSRVIHCSKKEMIHIELMTDPKVQETVATMLGIEYRSKTEKRNTGRSSFFAFFTTTGVVVVLAAIIMRLWL